MSMKNIKDFILQECISVLNREDIKDQIKNTMKPIINLLISQLYPYIFVSIVLVLISFLLILATFIMVLQIKFLTRVKKNIL
jgi:hypothetical protein